MARPTIDIDMDQLWELLRFRPTAEDAAAFFKCSKDTIERRIKEYTASGEFPEGLTFAEFREQALVHTKKELWLESLERAKKSDAVLIFLLKNFCGMTDKTQIDAAVVSRGLEQKSDEEIEARFRDLAQKFITAKAGE